MITEKTLQDPQEINQQNPIPNATGGEKREELKGVLDAPAYPWSDAQKELAENGHGVLRPDGRIDIPSMGVKGAKILYLNAEISTELSDDTILAEAEKLANEQGLVTPTDYEAFVLSQCFQEDYKKDAKGFATLFGLDPSFNKVLISTERMHSAGYLYYVILTGDRLLAFPSESIYKCAVFACEEIDA